VKVGQTNLPVDENGANLLQRCERLVDAAIATFVSAEHSAILETNYNLAGDLLLAILDAHVNTDKRQVERHVTKMLVGNPAHPLKDIGDIKLEGNHCVSPHQS
jgi:hypothetical protein